MKLLFIFCREKPYNSQSVREFPSGGTEKTAIFLGEAFQKLGHEVEWITTPDELRAYQGSPDIVITQVAELLQHFPDAKGIWWVHHFSDQPVIRQNAAYGRIYADRIVTLSRCQADDFQTNLRMGSVTIGHGVWRSELAAPIEKDPFRLIYASTPFRGLERIPALFRKIKEQEPRATIAICSSMATYGEGEMDAQYQKIFDELATIEGVELLGSLNQQALYAEYAKASVFFYPCIWPETYCLALDEAIAHGCALSVPDLGALHERLYMAVSEGEGLCPLPPEWFPGQRLYIGKQPKGWLEIAKQWEQEVLHG